jgi:hypothetical protein
LARQAYHHPPPSPGLGQVIPKSLSPCFGFLVFLLGFISSLAQLAWEKGFDVVDVVVDQTKLCSFD